MSSYLPKRQPAFTDLDKMPFGKHKGELLQDVPAAYLKWLFDEMHAEFKLYTNNYDCPNQQVMTKLKLYNYINNSYNAIEMELKGK